MNDEQEKTKNPEPLPAQHVLYAQAINQRWTSLRVALTELDFSFEKGVLSYGTPTNNMKFTLELTGPGGESLENIAADSVDTIFVNLAMTIPKGADRRNHSTFFGLLREDFPNYGLTFSTDNGARANVQTYIKPEKTTIDQALQAIELMVLSAIAAHPMALIKGFAGHSFPTYDPQQVFEVALDPTQQAVLGPTYGP